MSDLISRKEFMNFFRRYCCDGCVKSIPCEDCICAEFFKLIDNAPTISAVEVVRCADCRRFKYNLTPDGYLPEGVNETECMLFHCGMDYTDYCSYGERRTDE